MKIAGLMRGAIGEEIIWGVPRIQLYNVMCGRYALAIEPKDLPDAFGKQGLEVDKEIDADQSTHHRYNVGPTETAPVYFVRANDKVGPQHLIQYMRWGMVPKWVHHSDQITSKYPTFNARYEKIGQNRMWLTSVNQRCVIPIQGYYEWRTDDGVKQPYYICRKDGRLMFLAGLYSKSVIDEEQLYSYTIITWTAPSCLRWLHERMPVVLDPDTKEWSQWLDTGTKKKWVDVEQLLKVYEGDELEWYAVDRRVGNARLEDAEFVKPMKAEGESYVKEEPSPVKKEPVSPFGSPLKPPRSPKSPLKSPKSPLKSPIGSPRVAKQLKSPRRIRVKKESQGQHTLDKWTSK